MRGGAMATVINLLCCLNKDECCSRLKDRSFANVSLEQCLRLWPTTLARHRLWPWRLARLCYEREEEASCRGRAWLFFVSWVCQIKQTSVSMGLGEQSAIFPISNVLVARIQKGKKSENGCVPISVCACACMCEREWVYMCTCLH